MTPKWLILQQECDLHQSKHCGANNVRWVISNSFTNNLWLIGVFDEASNQLYLSFQPPATSLTTHSLPEEDWKTFCQLIHTFPAAPLGITWPLRWIHGPSKRQMPKGEILWKAATWGNFINSRSSPIGPDINLMVMEFHNLRRESRWHTNQYALINHPLTHLLVDCRRHVVKDQTLFCYLTSFWIFIVLNLHLVWSLFKLHFKLWPHSLWSSFNAGTSQSSWYKISRLWTKPYIECA